MTERIDPLEQLGRLAARTPSLLAGSGGKRAEWTQMDIAAALSGRIHGDPERLRNAHAPTLLVLAKYAFDAGAVWALQYAWWGKVSELCVRGQWTDVNKPDHPRLRIVAEGTLTEFLCGELCGICDGTGVLHNQQTCPACLGSKVEDRSTWWWSRQLHCRHEIAGQWMPRVRACMLQLEAWEAEGRGRLQAGLKPGEILD